MAYAKFQALTWRIWFKLFGWAIGVLRVYETNPGETLSPYKLAMTAVIYHHVVWIYGLSGDGINWGDLRACMRAMLELGVATAKWTHHGNDVSLELDRQCASIARK